MAITQTCRITGKQFTVTDFELEILGRMEIPPPTLCIEERLRRRLSHRNERTIYKRTCDVTNKPIISLYPKDSKFKVYSQEAWWSDKWDPKEYGRDFDFNKPFFEQFYDLQKAVPRIALLNTNAYNSEYCNITTDNKNCYLVFGGDFNEDCMYCGFNFHSKDTVDCYWIDECTLTYECVDCYNSYNLNFSQNCFSCRDSAFLYECRNCENCLMCVNLINKKYHILNKQYSPEEYKEKIKIFNLDTYSGIQKTKEEFKKIKLDFPHRHAYIINCENSVGDRLKNCKNATNCFDVFDSEDVKDIFLGVSIKDSLSCDHCGHDNPQLFYEMLGSIRGYNCAFCSFAWTSQNVFYSDFVTDSHDLFGCTNMRRAKYCILNKQYSKEEYDELLPRIIRHMGGTMASAQREREAEASLGLVGSQMSKAELKNKEWGEFFPIKFSPFAYNETIAQEYFPLTKESALSQGLNWQEENSKEYQPQTFQIPDSIKDANEKITDEVLACTKCRKNFKIIPLELKFYKNQTIPIPRMCHECRHHERLTLKNPLKLWDKNCAKCGMQIKTSYAPDRVEIVYCEKCYLQDVY